MTSHSVEDGILTNYYFSILQKVESSVYTPQMLSLLKNNSITLHIISMYEPLSSSRVLAVRYNDQASVLKGRSLKIALPQVMYRKIRALIEV